MEFGSNVQMDAIMLLAGNLPLSSGILFLIKFGRCGYQFCYICEAPPRGCKCSPGHGFYTVNAVRGNFVVTQVCYCNRVGGVCVCSRDEL